MRTKLTLTINKDIIESAKRYAQSKGRSLPDLVENYPLPRFLPLRFHNHPASEFRPLLHGATDFPI